MSHVSQIHLLNSRWLLCEQQANGNERNQRETKISIQQISSSIVTVAVNEALDRSIVPVFTSSLVSLFASQLERYYAASYYQCRLQSTQTIVSRIIVLDSISPAEYISSKWGEDLTPPYLRVLSSSAAPQITKLKQLEQPNIIKDLSAALVSYASIRPLQTYICVLTAFCM